MSAKVLIAIQARSNNTRLPGKCRMLVGGVPMLERVIREAKKSQNHIHTDPRKNIGVEVCVLVPRADPLAEEYRLHCPIIEGPEDDVLTRYHMALTTFNPDYIVRITADCPLIPPKTITAHIVRAVSNQLDYVSNCDPDTRTSADGHDVEVISRRLLEWVHKYAVTPYDREHVTPLIRKEKPDWATRKDIHEKIDYSQLKLSVDTEEDLFFVNGWFNLQRKKHATSVERDGGMFLV